MSEIERLNERIGNLESELARIIKIIDKNNRKLEKRLNMQIRWLKKLKKNKQDKFIN